MDHFNRLKAFKKDGFTVFERAYSPEMMAQWRDAYERRCAAEGEAVWLSGVFEIDPPLFLPAINNPAIIAFAEAVMGPFVQLDSLAINAFPSVAPAEAAGKVNAWHRDRYSQVPQTADYIHPLSCNTIFYLQDMTDAFGPLRVVPGSHCRPLVQPPRIVNCRARMSCVSTPRRAMWCSRTAISFIPARPTFPDSRATSCRRATIAAS
jgi:hypothetical protein